MQVEFRQRVQVKLEAEPRRETKPATSKRAAIARFMDEVCGAVHYSIPIHVERRIEACRRYAT